MSLTFEKLIQRVRDRYPGTHFWGNCWWLGARCFCGCYGFEQFPCQRGYCHQPSKKIRGADAKYQANHPVLNQKRNVLPPGNSWIQQGSFVALCDPLKWGATLDSLTTFGGFQATFWIWHAKQFSPNVQKVSKWRKKLESMPMILANLDETWPTPNNVVAKITQAYQGIPRHLISAVTSATLLWIVSSSATFCCSVRVFS